MITNDNVIWGIDPKREQMDFLTELLSDEWFLKELKTLIWGVKPNLKFYQGIKWAQLLELILNKFWDKYRILDAKCSDGINTEMGVIWEYRDRVDAITIAPASWDDLSYIECLQNPETWRKVDAIVMWAMSFPGTISDLIQWSFDVQKAKMVRNLEAWVSGVVMWATAYNTDVVAELEKLKAKIQGWSTEHACLKWYSDQQLVEWILLRNKLFAELLPLIAENEDTELLVPGFWRQCWSSNFFISGFDHSRSRFNAWSDIIKGLENQSVDKARSEVLTRLAAFLDNIQSLQRGTPSETKFTVPREFEFEKLLHTWEWLDLLKYIWAIYRRPEWWAYCRLASDLLSDTYINIAASERNYRVLQRAWKELAGQLLKRWITADTTMWAQMWSIRLSSYLAAGMWIQESVYTEKTGEWDSEMALKRHDIDLTWKRVVLSEDIVTKWTTLQKMIEIVKEKWWEVVAITCVWNRYWKNEFMGIPLISCFTPPWFGMFYDDKTPEENRWNHPKLLEWSQIAEKPKNEWKTLVESMRD